MAVNFSVTFSCAPGILKDTRMDLPEFLELFDAHHLPVYRFALRLTGSVADAEDIVQECFLGLLKPGSSYDPKRRSAPHISFRRSLEAISEAQRSKASLGARPRSSQSGIRNISGGNAGCRCPR